MALATSSGSPMRSYATNLRQLLIRMEKHYTQGYGDGKDAPTQPIELLPGAEQEAEKYLADDAVIRGRMNRVAELIEGFEDSYGLELLSSVHWVMQAHPEANENLRRQSRRPPMEFAQAAHSEEGTHPCGLTAAQGARLVEIAGDGICHGATTVQ